MALIVKYDEEQLQRMHDDSVKLTESVAALSENIAKWQGETVKAVIAGFASLTGVDPSEIQRQIDGFTEQLKQGTDELDAAVKANQPE